MHQLKNIQILGEPLYVQIRVGCSLNLKAGTKMYSLIPNNYVDVSQM